MRKTIILYIVFAMLYFLACEDELNPIGEYKEGYVLSLILRGDTTLQAAVLQSNYIVDGFDPYTHTEDLSVKGADIRVWQGDSVYVFKEAEIVRPDSARYGGKRTVYLNNYFTMDEFSNTLEVEVLLSTGKRMRAYSHTPESVEFLNDGSASAIPTEAEFFRIEWKTSDLPAYFEPRLIFNYTKNDGSGISHRTKVVPLRYEVQDGSYSPVFSTPSSKPAVIISNEALDSAMAQISHGDSDKGSYSIYEAYLQVLVYDKSLTNYYVSTNQALDGFSVKVDETDYSNVEGGLGIFGSYRLDEYKIKILRPYIQSFGYYPAIPD